MCAGTHILMAEVAEHAQFAVDPDGRHDVLEDVGHLLEGHTLVVARIRHRPDRKKNTKERCNENVCSLLKPAILNYCII